MIYSGRFLRDFEAGRFLDMMLVAAVTTVLVIRFYLELTGYPQIGGDSLHIAHMLWGGLLMLAAIVVLISFLGRAPQHLAALLGGVGFGTFIDEVGKFVTHDNDYFFEPSVSIMYVVFILIYLAIRSIHHERLATSKEYLLNALEEVGEVAVGDLDLEEKERALRYLARCEQDEPLARDIRQVLLNATVVPEERLGFLARQRDRIFTAYRRLATTSLFAKVLVTFFVGQLMLKIFHVTVLVFFEQSGKTGLFDLPILAPQSPEDVEFSLADWAQMATSLLSGIFVAFGAFYIWRDRLRGLRMFQRSILVSLFLTQVFIFYNTEWAGLVRLAFNLLVFFALGFMIEREKVWRTPDH